MIILIIVIVFISGYFNGTMDWIKKFKLDSESWLNKWETDHNGLIQPAKSYWYYLGLYKPEHEESFPYSSTILVFLTDEWHWNKFKMFLCYEFIVAGIVVYYENLNLWWIPVVIIILKTIRGIGFTLKYDKK